LSNAKPITGAPVRNYVRVSPNRLSAVPVPAARYDGLPRRRFPLSRFGSVRTRRFHAGSVIGNSLGLLPMRTEQLYCLDRVKPRIVHPMMRPTEIGEVVGIVVAAVLIEVGDHQTGLNLQAADDAAPEFIGGGGYASSFALPARQDRQGKIVWHGAPFL
jgi:hypothetical protein